MMLRGRPSISGARIATLAAITPVSSRRLMRDVLFTDGAKYLADAGGAYWLLDEIAPAQRHERKVAAEEFQHWKLIVEPDRTATLTCDDGNDNVVFSKATEFTDFPLAEIRLYCLGSTIMLPSEY
ncbi:MAG: DUF6876 family protein [Hyphomicrobiales bacterium]